MRCVDVDVLVHAHREDAPEHEAYRDWLDDNRRRDEPLGRPGVRPLPRARVAPPARRGLSSTYLGAAATVRPPEP